MRNSVSLYLQASLWKAIFLPILCVIGLTCLLIFLGEVVDRKHQFEHLSQYQTEQIADASEYALLFNDMNLIRNNIQSLLRQEDIVGVTYFNNKGNVIDNVGLPPDLSQPLPTFATHFYAQSRDHYFSTAPIYYSSTSQFHNFSDAPFSEPNSTILADAIGLSKIPQRELLGWIQVSSSTQRLQLENIKIAIASIGYFIFLSLLAVLACWYYAKRLAAPWLTLSNRLRLIQQGEFEKAESLSLPEHMQATSSALDHITERLRNYRTELESEINQITKETRENATLLEEKSAQLHIANREAMESNRLKTQFLANISHELRTPLNAILGYTNLLKKDELHPQQKGYVETITQSTNDLLATIGNILDFSKIEAGKTVVLECEDFNLKDTIDDVLHSLSSTLSNDAKDIDLIPSFSEELPDWVKGDKTRLRQILNNLVGNAIKFTHEGTIRVNVQCKAITLKELEIHVEVVDTGCGIANNKLGQLFKPFSQVDSSHTRSYAGTGLGLVITKKLIEQMGGNISVNSELGRGSNFFFQIKLEPSSKKTETQHILEESWLVLEPNTRYRSHLKGLFNQIAPHSAFSSTVEQFMAELHSPESEYFGVVLSIGDNQESATDAVELAKYVSTRFDLPYLILCKPLSYLAQDAQRFDLDNNIIQKPVSKTSLYRALSNQTEQSLQPEYDQYHETGSDYQHIEGLHVLAVDDTPINLQLLGHWLEPHSVLLSLAYSGSEAIKMAEKNTYDLILMDIQMPEMDGMQTARQLRKLLGYEETPIIALTAHALAEEQQSILASGMNAYLTKPINEETLLNTLTKWCASKVNLSQQVDEQLAEVFDVNKALNMAGNRSQAAKDLFEMLMQSLQEDQRLLNHHFANQDLEKLIATVHRIHGASKYSGTIELTKHANFLETHLKELGFDEVEDVYNDFMVALERLKNLQSLIAWPQASQKPEQNLAHPTD